jgi:CheY-like chemotaxis protein
VAKVLIIDDSMMMRLYLRRCLEKAGYTVEEWVTPVAMEIPEFIANCAPDLVISDYQMPGCDGATLARMVSKADPRLPLLFLTAFSDKIMEGNLLRLGVREVLAKPIEAAALIQAVEHALANPRDVH